MSGLVVEIKKCVDSSCLVSEKASKLEAGKCSVILAGAPRPRAIVDFDKPGSPLSRTRPDFLFVTDRAGSAKSGIIVPIEMSAGRSKDDEKIQEQLQAGLNWADKVISKKFDPTLYPLYFGKRKKANRTQIRRRDYKVRFRGQEETPRIADCGTKLVKALGLST